MATELSMNGKKKIETIQKEFSNKFPYLTLIFLNEEKQLLDVSKTLSEVRKSKGDDISIIASLKVNNLEKKFFKNYGLIVEVAYQQDGKVLITEQSEERTLNELNNWCETNSCNKIDYKKTSQNLPKSSSNNSEDGKDKIYDLVSFGDTVEQNDSENENILFSDDFIDQAIVEHNAHEDGFDLDFEEVKIGNQIWMDSNLNVSIFSNGDSIIEAKSSSEWVKANAEKKPAFCYYNFDEKNKNNYARYYNWYAVIDKRGLAPSGWAIPEFEDYSKLFNSIDSDAKLENGEDFSTWDGLISPALKSTEIWEYEESTNDDPDATGTNTSGFNVLGLGFVDNIGNFQLFMEQSYLWIRNYKNENELKSIIFDMSFTGILVGEKNNLNFGCQIRCIKKNIQQFVDIDPILEIAKIKLLEYNSNIIKIGAQIWMGRNLDVATFRNGDPIPQVKTDEAWEMAGENGEPAWCYYNNSTADEEFGKLYNWHAVNDPRGLAPEGWKIPSDEDWNSMADFLGGEDWCGIQLKSTSYWVDGDWDEDGSGANESGFSGLPGGIRSDEGGFSYFGETGYWWSSLGDSSSAWSQFLLYDNDGLYGENENKGSGLSVRCLRE